MAGALTAAPILDSRARTRRPFKAPVLRAVIWLVVGIVATALLWLAIWSFDKSLGDLSGWQLALGAARRGPRRRGRSQRATRRRPGG